MEVIYDEVKTEEKSWDTHPKTSGQFLQETKENHFGLHHRNLTFFALSLDDKKKPASHGRLFWAAASLGILCLILIFVIASLSISFTQEHQTQSMMLTAQNHQLQTEKAALQRQMQNLSRDRDQLNWTISVILDYQNFPVTELCPQKGGALTPSFEFKVCTITYIFIYICILFCSSVCKPCLDGWVLFQSNCYLFTKDMYSSKWKTWKKSQEFCKEKNADLVVIETLEEQARLPSFI
uniref:C-type lectin domain-containing protein n=1 Tax=Oryzias sinensis TaxID=183150 RepID=A0A8C8DFF5_9TELE